MFFIECMGFCPKYLPIIKLAASPKIAAAKSSNTMTWMFMPPMAAIPPAANSSESPGKNGVTTKPVSQKITTNKIA